MIDYSELLKKKNGDAEDNYRKGLEKIRQIKKETQNSENKFLKFAFAIADRILLMSDFEKGFSENYYLENTLEKELD